MDLVSGRGSATGKRGCTTLAKLTGKRGRYEKFQLEWNSKGQAVGSNRARLMSYIGVSARTLVDINFPQWKRVPKEVKDSVWKDVSSYFEVPPDKYKFVITLAAERWRGFKSSLKKRFMYDENGNICPTPPEIYSFINQGMWDKFIATRQSAEFLERSAKNREISKRNLYPYRGSRKGYVGIEEEILANKDNDSELPSEPSPSTSIPRSLLWKKARMDKNGDMDELTKQVVEKMESLSQQATESEIELSGRHDVLAAALGTEEHPGRVRGCGQGVTITKYFGRASPTTVPSKFIEKLHMMEAQVMALTRMVTELQSKDSQNSPPRGLFPSSSDVASCQEFPEGWTECELASSEPGNPTIAIGKVFNTHGKQPVMLHNKILEPGYMKVTIIDPKMQDTPLPVPTDEARTIFDAVGAFVAWPMKLVRRCDKNNNNDDYGDENNNDNNNNDYNNSPANPANAGSGFICRSETAFQPQSAERDEGTDKQTGTPHLMVAPTAPTSQPRPLRLIIRNSALNDSNNCSKGRKDEDTAKHIECVQSRPPAPSLASQSRPPAPSLASQSRPSQGDQVPVHKQQKLTTLTMKLMYRCTRGMTNLETINIDMPLAVMHHEHNILISKDEILQWLFQENIGVSHVSVYIKYLFNLCKEWGTSEVFGFLRPQNIPLDANNVEEAQEQYFLHATKGAARSKIFFVPYTDGNHWMLCVIHPRKDEAYWLDPAGSEMHPGVKKLVQLSIRKFHAHRRRKKPRGRTLWYEVKCPRQPSVAESGYCILRYMHEIIERGEDSIPEQYYTNSPAPGAYEQHHIDEIRDKWVEYVQNHMD